MSIYQDAISELRREESTSELYRFQGANSIEHFNLQTSRFNDISPSKDSYVYFSSSKDHHKYFTVKRIKQFLNQVVLKDTPYQLTNPQLATPDSYHHIKDLIINSDKIKDLYSVRLITDINFRNLIQDNYSFQREKHHNKSIERVDRRVYGGGYGITEEWKELLSYLTYFYAYRRINREDLIQLLTNMCKSGRVNKKDNLNFIIEKTNQYHIDLNQNLESSFTKYKIRQALESILEKGMTSPESELQTVPEEVIKKTIEDYEKRKEKILTIFNK